MHGIYTNMIYREIVYETINELQQLTSTKKTQKHKKIEIDKKKRQNKKKKRNTTNTVNFSTWSKLNIFPKTNKAFYTLCRSIRKYKKKIDNDSILVQSSLDETFAIHRQNKHTHTDRKQQIELRNFIRPIGASVGRYAIPNTHLYNDNYNNKQTNKFKYVIISSVPFSMNIRFIYAYTYICIQKFMIYMYLFTIYYILLHMCSSLHSITLQKHAHSLCLSSSW